MAAVFAQMWVLCLLSFLLGGLLTWLAIGPARRRPAPPEPSAAPEPMDPVQAAQAPPSPLPGVPRHARRTPGTPSIAGPVPTNPALAGLDSVPPRRTGSAALGALDRLRHPGPEPDPQIPRQPGAHDRRPGRLFTPPDEPEPPPAGG